MNIMVGATGFEPVTFAPPVQCATELRHAPKSAGSFKNMLR